MPADIPAGFAGAQVNIRGLPSHGKEQPNLVAVARQNSQLDARTERREPTNNPRTMEMHKRIGIAHRAVDNGLIQDFSGSLFLVGPLNRRWRQRFGFASDSGSAA